MADNVPVPDINQPVVVDPKPKMASKTLWFNLAVGALMAADWGLKQADVIALLPPAVTPWIPIVAAGVNYLLRFYTHTPLVGSPGEMKARYDQ